MKELLVYCYYRIAKAYKVLDPKYYLEWGFWILSFSFSTIALSITTLILHSLWIELNDKIILLVFTPFLVVDAFFSLFINDEKKIEWFNKTDERYKGERFKRLKGWLVFFYLIGTVVLYILVL